MNLRNGSKGLNSTSRGCLGLPATGHTLELIHAAASRLAADAIDAPRLCAELLLAHALSCERIDLYTHFDRPVPEIAVARLERLLERRIAREPLQHILGVTEFWSLSIPCSAAAFIPRPETELVVQAAVQALSGNRRPHIADIGTGTGCIALALAHELKDARIVASDISTAAFRVAEENVRLHGLAKRVTLLEGDLAAPFLDRGMRQCFDAVVCNPPYVAEAEQDGLQPEVRDFDPPVALFAGADGLDVLRRLLREAPAMLREDGFLIMELGDGQAGPVREMMQQARWRNLQTMEDGTRVERVVIARRP